MNHHEQGWEVTGLKCCVPHEGEADLEGRRVVLVVDDNREEEGSDEVGQRDNDWGQIFIDEIHNEILLQTSSTKINNLMKKTSSLTHLGHNAPGHVSYFA